MSDCSTHAFDVPLKPCPFCGSGWLYETRRNGYCDETPTMFCNSCEAVVTWEQVEEEDVNDETKAFVREHWNTRAERTCHAESDLSEWVCSECQCWIPLGLTPENIKHASEWRYCPHCGARVKAVSDDER